MFLNMSAVAHSLLGSNQTNTLVLGTSNTSGVSGLPPWPAELRTRIFFNHTDSRPNPINVYCIVIEVLFRMSLQPWNGLLNPQHFAVVEQGNTFYAMSTMLTSELRTKYMFQATVEFLVAMKNDGWYSGFSQVYLGRRPVAMIILAAVRNAGTPESTQALIEEENPLPSLNNRTKITSRETAPSANPAEMWRTIVDPQMLDGRTVRWRYDPDGSSIPSHEMFMMFADGLAEVAQHAYAAPCAAMDAIGPSGIAVFYIDSHGRSTRAEALRWFEVAATIAALALDGMVAARRFAEVEFELLSGGHRVASGYILRRETTESRQQQS
ncbi:MAG: hypothetical protein Q9219_007494 [cf. Caloplaca sp. 3 TL-2023]